MVYGRTLDVPGSDIYTIVDWELERTKHVVKVIAQLLPRTKKAAVVDKGRKVSCEGLGYQNKDFQFREQRLSMISLSLRIGIKRSANIQRRSQYHTLYKSKEYGRKGALRG